MKRFALWLLLTAAAGAWAQTLPRLSYSLIADAQPSPGVQMDVIVSVSDSVPSTLAFSVFRPDPGFFSITGTGTIPRAAVVVKQDGTAAVSVDLATLPDFTVTYCDHSGCHDLARPAVGIAWAPDGYATAASDTRGMDRIAGKISTAYSHAVGRSALVVGRVGGFSFRSDPANHFNNWVVVNSDWGHNPR